MQGSGLSPKQLEACQKLVYIPQFGPGTASLNVSVAAAIVLHQFSTWAGYSERPRAGQKYVLGARPPRTGPRGVACFLYVQVCCPFQHAVIMMRCMWS